MNLQFLTLIKPATQKKKEENNRRKRGSGGELNKEQCLIFISSSGEKLTKNQSPSYL